MAYPVKVNFAALPSALKVSPELAVKFNELSARQEESQRLLQEAINAVMAKGLDINTELQLTSNALWKELEAELKITSTDGLANWSLDSTDVENCYTAPRDEVNDAIAVLAKAFEEESATRQG